MQKTRLRSFGPGEVLFREGETSRDLYIVQSGTVHVSKTSAGREVPIARLGKGAFIGEMAFISGLPRSATVVAEEDVTANVITTDVLKSDAFGVNDWAVNIARVLADRIRKTTALIAEYEPHDTDDDSGRPIQTGTINEFEIKDAATEKHASVQIRGICLGKHLNALKDTLRGYASRGFESVTLDFADVPDVDKEVLDFLVSLSGASKPYRLDVTIRNVQLIRSKILSVKGIERLVAKTKLPMRRVEQHEYLIKQGDTDQMMYVVKTGRFAIVRTIDDNDVTLAHAEAGDVIGEMSLLTGAPRSAGVRALQSSVVFEIPVDDFQRNVYGIPTWFMRVVRVLVDRLRRTNDNLERAVRRQFREATAKTDGSPIGLSLDSAHPGTIKITGHLIKPNLEYLSTAVNLVIRRGAMDLTVDLRSIESIDYACMRYLLQLYRYMEEHQGTMDLPGAHHEIRSLFRQYEIELP